MKFWIVIVAGLLTVLAACGGTDEPSNCGAAGTGAKDAGTHTKTMCCALGKMCSECPNFWCDSSDETVAQSGNESACQAVFDAWNSKGIVSCERPSDYFTVTDALAACTSK